MSKFKIDYPERGADVNLGNIEIVTDGNKMDRVEIYMLDPDGNRLEGGDFNLPDFIDVVLKFYNENF